MTKHDYELLAQVIRNTIPANNSEHLYQERLILHLSQELERDNPRFDKAKFYLACQGVIDG